MLIFDMKAKCNKLNGILMIVILDAHVDAQTTQFTSLTRNPSQI